MEFGQKVLALCRKIPRGKVSTYGIMAKILKTSPRPVGQALKRNKTAFCARGRSQLRGGAKTSSKTLTGFTTRKLRLRWEKQHAKTLIPCHRVVKSDRSLGGYSRGLNKKIKLLKKEGIKVKNNKIENFEKVLFRLRG